eukprot:jgi/Psemu1/21779/gm1.21779_g
MAKEDVWTSHICVVCSSSFVKSLEEGKDLTHVAKWQCAMSGLQQGNDSQESYAIFLVADPGDQFPILLPCDLDNCLIDDNKRMSDEDTQRFKNPRDGDHLMTPFQCASSKLPLTPSGVRKGPQRQGTGEATRYFDYHAQLGTEVSCLPPQGPTPQEDSCDMKVACAMLLRSREPDRNTQCAQEERKQICVHLYGQFTLVQVLHYGMPPPDGSYLATRYTGDSGDYRHSSRPHRGEMTNDDCLGREGKFDFTCCTVMFLAGFYGGLHGGNLQDLLNSDNTQFAPLTLAGSFKNQTSLTFFTQSLAPRTKKEGRSILERFERMRLACAKNADITTGVVIMDLYSTFRSFRRGSTSAAQNTRVNVNAITSNIWDYTHKLCLVVTPPTGLSLTKGCVGSPNYPTKTLGGWWTNLGIGGVYWLLSNMSNSNRRCLWSLLPHMAYYYTPVTFVLTKAKQLRANTNTNQRRNKNEHEHGFRCSSTLFYQVKDLVISRQTKTKRRHAVNVITTNNGHLFVTSASLPIDRGNSSSPATFISTALVIHTTILIEAAPRKQDILRELDRDRQSPRTERDIELALHGDNYGSKDVFKFSKATHSCCSNLTNRRPLRVPVSVTSILTDQPGLLHALRHLTASFKRKLTGAPAGPSWNMFQRA